MVALLDSAQCQANHERFVRRVIEQQIVWYLQGSNGIATSSSHEDGDTAVLMYWSDRAYATRVRNGYEIEGITGFEEVSMDLFDFLFRWLPGMTTDSVLAGTNWTGDLIGFEHDPFVLREEIEAAMSNQLRLEYEDRYAALTRSS